MKSRQEWKYINNSNDGLKLKLVYEPALYSLDRSTESGERSEGSPLGDRPGSPSGECSLPCPTHKNHRRPRTSPRWGTWNDAGDVSLVADKKIKTMWFGNVMQWEQKKTTHNSILYNICLIVL